MITGNFELDADAVFPVPPPTKSQFDIYSANGEYVRFTGTLGSGVLNEGGNVVFPIVNIEVEERGSIYDCQGAD